MRRALLGPTVDEVVCATDAGREGELILRFVHEAAGCRTPVRRPWISSLTDDAIRLGFRQLRDGRSMEPLAQAAKGRARADRHVGMSLSRTHTLSHDTLFSVGRVQTPTLAMVVERENAFPAMDQKAKAFREEGGGELLDRDVKTSGPSTPRRVARWSG